MMDKPTEKPKRHIIKFAPSFRESAKKNLGLSEDEVRQLELDVIKSQAELREGIEDNNE